jgi:hypothetical protein
MQWNLHLVGEELEDELQEVLTDLVTRLEGIGHRLVSATLTTDAGPKSLPTTPQPEPEQTVGGEPVAPTTPAPAEPVDASVPSDSSTSAPSTDSALSPDPTETVAPVDGGPAGPDVVATDTPPSLGDPVTPA